ncbi:hypothetical protein D3C80_535170 [compost metagenome]
MSGSPLNNTRHMKKQGLDSATVFAGVVVDNNDPRKAGRVRVRVPDVMPDAIPDNHLPWALPTNQAYAVDADKAERAGSVDVPPKGAKVGVRYPTGDPHKPELAPYPGDKKTILKEAEKNYPNRKVIRLDNGCYMIIDKSTNEVFVTNPGDSHFVFLGDYSKTVVGKCTEIVSGSVSDVPEYLLNASDTKIQEIAAKSAGGVSFKGSGGAGSKYEHIKGDYTLVIDGNRIVKVKGNDSLNVGRNRDETVTGNHKIMSMRSDTN